ncbi:MAG: TIM barrel protein [Clostridia bacterium]|nr:TIM barrel protein [Clostridia bacterium]
MKPLFGPAGNSEEFYSLGYKATIQAMGFLEKKGLDAYEYQCGRGVNIKEETARALGQKAKEHGIAVSLHAPYYTSLNSPDEQKRLNSVRYIIDSCRAVDWMGGNRVVVHPGGLGKMTRRDATDLAKTTINLLIDELKNQSLDHIHVCFETMGKVNQLGDMDEIIEFCAMDESFYPCVDFGHLNARTHGGCSTGKQFKEVFDRVEASLGAERSRHMHCHFSKIEYSKGGEVRHLTFEDDHFGPDYKPLMEEVYRRGAYPVFICESAGTQSQDSLDMKRFYKGLAAENAAANVF